MKNLYKIDNYLKCTLILECFKSFYGSRYKYDKTHIFMWKRYNNPYFFIKKLAIDIVL